jgi:lipoprotein-anchoring transpeptidase ErfK/SrfK
MKLNVEAEEMAIRNSHGDVAIVPAHDVDKVRQMIKEGCHGCIDSYVSSLPKFSRYAEDGTLYPVDDEVTLVKPSGERVRVKTSSDYYRMHYNNNLIGDKNSDGTYSLKDEIYKGATLAPVAVTGKIEPDTYAAYNSEFNKTGKPDNERTDYLASRLLSRENKSYNEKELASIKNSSYLKDHPEFYDQDVVAQLERNKDTKFNTDYLVISDANSRGYHVSKEGKVLKTFPVITGMDAGETSKISMRDWIAQNPGKTPDDYFAFLTENKIRYTPSGVYFVGKRVDDPSQPVEGSIANQAKLWVKKNFKEEDYQDIIKKRFHSYGNKGLIALKHLDSDVIENTDDQKDIKGIGEAIHGTGTEERLKQLHNPAAEPSDRKMSKGCINLDDGSITYCYDQLEKNSPVFLLREDGKELNPNVVNYINKPKPHRILMNNLYNDYEKLKSDFGNKTDDFMNYAANIAGLESGYGDMSVKGEMKEWLAKQLKKDPSVGATQIKWGQVSEATKEKLKKFGINSADDLDKLDKATIAAMYVLKDKYDAAGGNIDKAVKSYVGAAGDHKKYYIKTVEGQK